MYRKKIKIFTYPFMNIINFREKKLCLRELTNKTVELCSQRERVGDP